MEYFWKQMEGWSMRDLLSPIWIQGHHLLLCVLTQSGVAFVVLHRPDNKKSWKSVVFGRMLNHRNRLLSLSVPLCGLSGLMHHWGSCWEGFLLQGFPRHLPVFLCQANNTSGSTHFQPSVWAAKHSGFWLLDVKQRNNSAVSHLSFYNVSIYLLVWLSVCLSICLPVCQSACLPGCSQWLY